MTIGETQNIPLEDANKPSAPRPPSQESQVFSVRISAGAVPAFLSLIEVHFNLKHIPQQTESAYLQYLVTQDAEKMRDDILNRRKALAR